MNLNKASVGTLEDVAVNPPQIHILSMEDDEFQSDNENVSSLVCLVCRVYQSQMPGLAMSILITCV